MNSPSAIGTATHKLAQGIRGSPLAGLLVGPAQYSGNTLNSIDSHPFSVDPAAVAVKAKASADSGSTHKTEIATMQSYSSLPNEDKIGHAVAAAVPDIQGEARHASPVSPKGSPPKPLQR